MRRSILILSDEKRGHVKQSESVADQLLSVRGPHDPEGMESSTRKIEIRFKSKGHRHFFPWFAFVGMPWIRGRLPLSRFFFQEESQKLLEEAKADLIISAGSALAPLNLCLAKACSAKSIVLMKPSFPFNLFRYDLVIVPKHDRGWIPKRALRTLMTPNQIEPGKMQEAEAQLSQEMRDPARVKVAVFLGGSTRRYCIALGAIKQLFQALSRAMGDRDYVVTTSRRTSDEITGYLKEEIASHEHCQMLVIAAEDSRPIVASGMMSLAEILIVTEDSISMISEGIAAGKKVVVIDFQAKGLPQKHRRFREALERESAVVTATPARLEEVLQNLEKTEQPKVYQQEIETMRGTLREIL